MKSFRENSALIIAVIILCIFFIVSPVYRFTSLKPADNQLSISVAATDKSVISKLPTKEDSFEKLKKIVNSATAQSVFIYDVANNSVVIEKNAQEIRSLASLSKLVTATLTYESHPSKSSKAYILPQIQHMLTTSSNEEAEQLAYSFGKTVDIQVAHMNSYGKDFGLSFKNVSGLDITYEDLSYNASSQGTAEGIARLTRKIYVTYPEIFDTSIKFRENTNRAVNQLSFMLGGKTGFTDLAGGNLMVIVQKGISRPYIIVVLGSTENGRFVDVENIAEALLQLEI